MEVTPGTDRSSCPRIPFRVYLVCYVLLGVLLIYALVFRWLRPVVLEEPIRIEPARVAQVEQQIDPNVATWPELARLPGVGEALAKRIVAYREERQRAAQDTSTSSLIVFRSVEDLDEVAGIGDKAIQQMRPHLKFPAPARGR
jgi:competence ComEA-like helix-hairpin-helix protein